ncbi:hypothetical protein N8I77_003250 [Diaporthe amygdali]|uniref:Translation initiation factor IF-2, mitochondrial n=1 Tax=Phomopsis amygdali TaxID=1214568 RepID=A0AAD9SJY1_PHOAM|nr:hypothetical protein N8I77_003250 [Diaporthe amygdali]
MLRSQVQKQGGFYVCASCRRQNRHSLTQLRSRAPTPGRAISSASQLFSSASRTLSSRQLPRDPRDAAPQIHNDSLSVATRTGVRGYSSYGKFGSGTLPGQTNADWAKAVSPSGWGGRKPGASKITPAKPTSVAPAASTSMPDSGLPSTSASGQQSAASAQATASGDSSENLAQDRAWQPTDHRPFHVQAGFADRNSIRPARETDTGGGKLPDRPASRIPGLSGRGSMGSFKSEAIPRRENAPYTPLPASEAHSKIQQPGPHHQHRMRPAFSVKREVSRPQRPPSGSEYPQLRRRSPSVDDFETLSPFNLPDEGKPSSPPPTNLPLDKPSRRSTTRTIRLDLGSSPRKPRVGDSAPDPVDSVANSSVERSSSRLEAALDVGRRPSRESSKVSKPVDQFSLMRDASNTAQGTQNTIAKDSDWGLLKSDLVSPGEQYARRRREEARDFPAGDMASSEERHAQRRRENIFNQPGYRGQDSGTRPARRERESDRRGRGRDVERSDGKPKKRQNYRARDYDEGDEDEHDPGFDYEEYRARKEATRRRKEEKRAAKEASAPKTILLPEYITVFDLAQALGVKPQQFLSDLGELGFENILHDSIMTGETAALVAGEYGLDPILDTGDNVDLKPRPAPEDPSALPPRPPIVTIMGHVDHGKTTMLDWLRKSSVAAQEHGGITQHIGAFSVRLSAGKVITFLDTPGHAAFLSMRQRGANVTDIVVLVVAVDDSVKPQTLEALKHAQNAKVPIIVAINKIDMDERRIDHVKQDLAANGVEIEDFGGDVQVVAVSGKTGKGMDDLEESILTLSEILDVRAETDDMAEGWILEASVKVDGKAATVLVKRGTLRVGDLIVAGTTYARIRMMRNEAGAVIEEAGPGTPVEVLGWRDSPAAGDLVIQAEDEDRAHAAVDYRAELADRTRAAAQKGEEEVKNREKAEQEALEKMMAEGGEDAVPAEAEQTGPKTVNIIVRGDVMGSVEAVCAAVMEIGNNEVQSRILRSSPGQINESDVDLMAVAKGCIINFNSPIPGFIKSMAEAQGVRILDHTIIYHLVEDVKTMMSEQLAPIISQKVLAEAEVLQVFAINIVKRKFRNIAGVKVRTGSLTRGGLYRVMRNGEKVFEGKLDALKQGKKDVKEMRRGTECGLSFEAWDEFEPGDIIQLFEEVQQKRYL